MKLCAAEGIHLPPGPLETAAILMLQFVQTQQEREFKIISRKKKINHSIPTEVVTGFWHAELFYLFICVRAKWTEYSINKRRMSFRFH